MPTPTQKIDSKPTEDAQKPVADKPLEAASASAKFLQSIIGGEAKKPEPKKKAEGDEPEPKPAPKKKPAPASAAPSINEEKLGAAIGRSLAEHSKGEGREKPVEAEKPKPTAADAAETRRIAVLERMEAINSERYKGLAGRYKANQAELRKRAAAWEKDHPSESYSDMIEAYEADPDANVEFADEAQFAARLEAESDYEDDDYTEALADLRADKKLEEKLSPRESKLEERLSEIERTEKARKSSREISQVAFAAGNDCWKALGDDFSGVVNKDGSINLEALKEINEADPVKHDIAVRAATTAETGAATLHMLWNGMEKFDEKNQKHAVLSQFAVDMEQAMLSKDPEEQTAEDGRRFATKEQWMAMTEQQRARHFIFTENDLKALWVHDVAKRAKADLQAEDEKFTRRARARGLIDDEPQPTARTAKRGGARVEADGDGDDGAADDGSGKPQSPAFTLSPKLSAGKGGNRNGSENTATSFVKSIFG